MSTFKGFTHVQVRKPERSLFDMSHEKKLTTRMGRLTPIFITETLPNDTFKVNSEVMLRLAPLLAPIYHRVHVYVHYYFIPNRLLWEDWEEFITNGRLGTELAPVPPHQAFTQNYGYFDPGHIADYLGINPAMAYSTWEDKAYSMLPFGAWYKVWYDYYRDRNYDDDNEILPMASGAVSQPDGAQMMMRRSRSWQADYFTSSLPWTQRGDEVLMPLMGSGSVNYYASSAVRTTAGATAATVNPLQTNETGNLSSASVGNGLRIENIESVDIENSSVSINDLRQAVRLQEWLEKNAVAGSRYNESILVHFARKTSDGRLQRAEYIGGGRVNVQISEVMTTAWSEDESANSVPPANMSGRGAAYSKSNRARYNCEEHGFIVGIMSVMPTSAYMQGMPRMFLNRQTFLDYPWPSFAHLGEQPVYTYEVFANENTVPEYSEMESAEVFGYQSRYADWKWIPSTAHGDFRTTLDYWHLDRKFESKPALSKEFVEFEDELQDRIFAVAESDTLWCYIYNKCTVVRSLPYFGTPTL